MTKQNRNYNEKFIKYQKFIIKHAAYKGMPMRVVGSLTNADVVTESTFWIGVYPGLTKEIIDFMVGTITEFVLEKPK